MAVEQPSAAAMEPSTADEKRASVRAYLVAHQELAEVIREAGRKMRSYSGLSGEVTLKSPRAVAGVRGIGAILHGRDMRVRLTELNDALLHRTAFACTLRDAVDALSETPLVLRNEDRRWRTAAAHWFADELAERIKTLGPLGRTLFDECTATDAQWCKALIDAAMAEASAEERKRSVPDTGRLRTLRELADLWLAIRAVVRARESDAPVLLAILAETLTGDPHALDPDQSGGRAFLVLLQQLASSDSVQGLGSDAQQAESLPVQLPSPQRAVTVASTLSADERAALFAANNVAIDGISSTVAIWHVQGGGPLLAAARATKIPIVLPLAALDKLPSDDPVRAAGDVVWVVENPAAFQALITAMCSRPTHEQPTIVCGSGFLSLAALRLLDRLVASGARMLYSGDWDANGLAIAHGAMKRWPNHVRLWRMDPTKDALATKGGADDAPWRTDQPAMPFTADARKIARERPRYQEAWIKSLIADLQAALDESCVTAPNK